MASVISGCDCELNIEPYGTAQTVSIACTSPTPTLQDGYTLVSYDANPLMTPNQTSSVQVSGTQDPLYSYHAPASFPSYFRYDCFTEPILCQVPYDNTKEFTLALDITFARIVMTDQDGVEVVEENVRCQITATKSYTQHPETGGWGSEQQKNLFIPWQDIR